MELPQILGLILLALAGAIVWKQARARACGRHSRLAGRVAMLLALTCAGVGTALLVGALG